jgi:hypothetical protein
MVLYCGSIRRLLGYRSLRVADEIFDGHIQEARQWSLAQRLWTGTTVVEAARLVVKPIARALVHTLS